MTVTELAAADATLTDMVERAAERGYLLLSELEDLGDPLDQAWLDDVVTVARDRGVEVIDDLAAESDADHDTDAHERLTLSADPVRQYLNLAGRYQLLTKEDEADLAKRYQAGLAADRMLIASPRLSPRRRARLRTISREGHRAQELMVRSNLRLVVPQAKKWVGRGLDMIELIQEGNLGLIRAVEKFDHTKGYKFSTYAVWWIRQALQRGVSNKARTVRVPSHIWEQSAKVRRVEIDLRQRLGRDPTEEEISRASGLTIERIREVEEVMREATSLDRPVGEDGDATMGELMADEDAIDPEASAALQDARVRIARALAELDERERRIVELRFGFLDGQERTLAEIGAEFGMSRERIRQLEKEALAKLRHPASGIDLVSLRGDLLAA